MAENEISVDLRLSLEKLRADVVEAKKQIQAGLTLNISNVVPDAGKAGDAVDKLTSRVRQSKSAVGELAAEFQKLKSAAINIHIAGEPGSKPPGLGIHGVDLGPTLQGVGNAPWSTMAGGVGANYRSQVQAQWRAYYNSMAGIAAPGYSGPTPPVIAPPVIGGAGVGGGGWASGAAQGALRGIGMSGVSGPLIAAAAAAMAVAAALRAMHRVVEEVTNAFRGAASLYGRIMTGGGMAPGWQVQRNVISQVMGISESEVMRFGAAFRKLAADTREATATLTRTMPDLTGTVWNFRVLMLELRAQFAEVAQKMAPVLNQMIEFARYVMSMAEVIVFVRAAVDAQILAWKGIMVMFAASITLARGLRLAFIALMETIAFFIDRITHSFMPPIRRLAQLTFGGKDPLNLNPFKHTKEEGASFMEELKKLWGNIMNPKDFSAPSPVADPRRMPSSPWERMGLVIGAGGGTNYQRETAVNTKRTADTLARMAKGLMPRGNNGVMNIPVVAGNTP